jgi:hypothetical protein
MENITEKMRSKKELPEPTIVYKQVHGQLVPVKIYPTIPLDDTFDNQRSPSKQAELRSMDYTYDDRLIQELQLEYISKLNN